MKKISCILLLAAVCLISMPFRANCANPSSRTLTMEDIMTFNSYANHAPICYFIKHRKFKKTMAHFGAKSISEPWKMYVESNGGKEKECINGRKIVFLFKNTQVNYTYGKDKDGSELVNIDLFFDNAESLKAFIDSASDFNYDLKSRDERNPNVLIYDTDWSGYVMEVRGYSVSFYPNQSESLE